jgi:hypothetical protein
MRMVVHAPIPAHYLCLKKCTRVLQDVLDIYFRLFLSPQSAFRRGKVGFHDFVSIFSQNVGRQLGFINKFYSIDQCDCNALCFMLDKCVLRSEGQEQNFGH